MNCTSITSENKDPTIDFWFSKMFLNCTLDCSFTLFISKGFVVSSRVLQSAILHRNVGVTLKRLQPFIVMQVFFPTLWNNELSNYTTFCLHVLWINQSGDQRELSCRNHDTLLLLSEIHQTTSTLSLKHKIIYINIQSMYLLILSILFNYLKKKHNDWQNGKKM